MSIENGYIENFRSIEKGYSENITTVEKGNIESFGSVQLLKSKAKYKPLTMVTIRDCLVSYIELLGYIENKSGYIDPK